MALSNHQVLLLITAPLSLLKAQPALILTYFHCPPPLLTFQHRSWISPKEAIQQLLCSPPSTHPVPIYSGRSVFPDSGPRPRSVIDCSYVLH